MKTKSLFSASIFWLLISTFNFSFYGLAFSQDNSNGINNIQVSIQSPQNNTSYNDSNILLNGSIEFSVHEEKLHSADSLSQEFSANYSLDNGEWKSLPFSSFTSKEEFSDPIIGGYWNTLEGTYSAVLQDLSEGPHSIRVTVNPHIYWWIAVPEVSFKINATADRWVTKAPIPTARFSFGAAVVNGKIFAIGGAVNSLSALLAVNEEYDPIADKWSEKVPMPKPTYGFAVAVYENRIYVFGGGIDNYSTLTNVTLMYDPPTDRWVTKAPMPIARNLLQANVVDGKIYLIGGYPYPNATLNEVYDPVADTWTTKTPIPIPVIAYASAVVDNKIYVISGASFENATSPAVELSLTQIYDPKTDTWSSGAPIPNPVDSAGVGVITDAEGRKAIYVVGGETDIFSPQTIFQVYFPENNSWSMGPSLPILRSRLCAAVVNNAIYAMGGTRIIGHQGLLDNEQYAPFGTVPISSSSPSPSIPELSAFSFLILLIAVAMLSVVFVRRKMLPRTN